MSFSHAFFVLTVVFFLSVIVYAIFLRIGGMLAQIPSAGYGNSFKAAFTSGIFGMLVCLGGLLLQGNVPGTAVIDQWNVSLSPPVWILIVQILVMLLVTTLIVKIVLFAEFGQAAMATVVMVVPGTIFAFLFCFLTERFWVGVAIPTVGAMAPTIEDPHTITTCENCGFSYGTRVPDWMPQGNQKPPTSFGAACPNCGQPVKIVPETPLAQGDRCLVARGATPQRWDIVSVRPGGNESGLRMYRVAGLPGESVELVGGNVFVGKRDSKTRVQREPDAAHNMWILVHDTKYHPQQAVSNGPQWKPARSTSNWQYADDKWTCTSESAAQDDLYFTGRITDLVGFNLSPPPPPPAPPVIPPSATPGKSEKSDKSESTPPAPLALSPEDEAALRAQPRPVGDLLLEVSLATMTGSGGLTMTRDFAGQAITAKIDCSGRVELRSVEEGKSATGSGNLEANVGTSAEVALMVRDNRAWLLEKGVEVAKIDLGPQDIESARARRQRIGDAVPRVRVGVTSGSLTLRRIKLSRDVYYRSSDEMPLQVDPARRQSRPLTTKVTLKDGEYFLLGDNSMNPWDSRLLNPFERAQLSGTVGAVCWPTSHARRLD